MVAVESMLSASAALADAGIDLTDIDAGKVGIWQRVTTADKPHKRNGAVLVLNSYPLRLFFKNFATDAQGHYGDQSTTTTHRPYDRRPTQLDQCRVAELAQKNWSTAVQVTTHPYLESKQVRAHRIRQLGRRLLIPASDASGYLWTYQTIDEVGSKLFLKGGRKHGCYFPLGSKPTQRLLIAEGYATAASLYEATGLPVAVCFDCGNLLSVSQALRSKLPDVEFVFCADNDANTPSNPGIEKATKAASVTGGRVIYPNFKARDSNATDWNDYVTLYGATALSECLREMLDV